VGYYEQLLNNSSTTSLLQLSLEQLTGKVNIGAILIEIFVDVTTK
jgi:hypothetical protein